MQNLTVSIHFDEYIINLVETPQRLEIYSYHHSNNWIVQHTA